MEVLLRADSCRKVALSRRRNHAIKAGSTGLPGSPASTTSARRLSMVECVGTWGAETPFDSLSDYMLEKTMPVSGIPFFLNFKKWPILQHIKGIYQYVL